MSFDKARLDDLAVRYTDAWNSKVPENVAAFYVQGGQISINRGDPWLDHEGLAAMAAGFYADVPDLVLKNEGIRSAGSHVVFLWTFIGHHAVTGNPVKVRGWEEWELDDDLNVKTSLGWFDAAEYQRQVDGSAN